VSYFFCLSGFIMAVVYCDTGGRGPLNLRSFSVARFARIYPVYLLAVLFSLSMPAWRATGLNISLSVLLVQAWVPGHAIAINAPAWSLSTEAFFYLAFPLLLRWLQALALRSLLIVTAVVWLASQVPFLLLCSTWVGPFLSPSFDLMYYSPVFNINAFIVGMAGGLAIRLAGDRIPRWSGWRADAAVTLAVAALAGALYFQDWLGSHTALNLPFTNGVLAPLHLAVIGTLALFRSTWSRVLGSRPLVFLGGASYAVYLFQVPVRTWYELHVLSRTALGDEASFILYLGLLIAVSALVFSFCESPLRAGLRRLARN
jgi:peptidoglycan/LPS O-acetylase OafA/YrhL